ncbi:uncharacterized protein cubi_00985 [Cryptosporidium ubiquitum]|uniref:Uncharacterized protein n=1 Tax=Cryptosporidium ubiquitum TaxID=857276 RepID=A0A1J4M9E6_9CRYT|nr:uncharacterized protein cubi_00985 [Cryptosporidium ubiquitum]OII70840.1 hypothetical protein cubi_00985 [Cryptosporidium ubiquitum]
MRLKTATLINIIFLIDLLFGFYYDRNIKQIRKSGDCNLDTIYSLLEIWKRKPKKKSEYASPIEESDKNSDSEIESNDQNSKMNNKKKKKSNKLKKRLKRIPRFFRRIFRRKKGKNKIKRRVKHKKKHLDDHLVSIEKPQIKVETPDKPKTDSKPEVEIESSSRFKSVSIGGNDIDSSQNKLLDDNSPEPLDAWKISRPIRQVDYGNEHFISELKNKLLLQQDKYGESNSLITGALQNRKGRIKEMANEQLYSYLDNHISTNTGGINLIINLNELISSTSIDRKFLEQEPINNNIEEAIKKAFKKEDDSYRVKIDTLYNLYNQNVGHECTFSFMDDLIRMYYNAFMEFKSVEEGYYYLLDPRKNTQSDRAGSINKTFYGMKDAKSKMREILMKYVNCHMLTFFFIRIDDINIGNHEEKCTTKDLIILIYYQNVFLALKKLNYFTLKEKENEISELNQMFISGIDSLSEEKRIKYNMLYNLSNKLLSLENNATLYGELIQVIDQKLSLCLTYIVRNYESNQEYTKL